MIRRQRSHIPGTQHLTRKCNVHCSREQIFQRGNGGVIWQWSCKDNAGQQFTVWIRKVLTWWLYQPLYNTRQQFHSSDDCIRLASSLYECWLDQYNQYPQHCLRGPCNSHYILYAKQMLFCQFLVFSLNFSLQLQPTDKAGYTRLLAYISTATLLL